MATPRKPKSPKPEVQTVTEGSTTTVLTFGVPEPAVTTFGPAPTISGHADFRLAAWRATPDELPRGVEAEILRHRGTRDGVTPEQLTVLRAELLAFCQRLLEWRRG